ncbi:MAG: ribonuclease HII, partial [Campylobacter sp.]|nr:ribonuclease HII [Campylobacter sp.]
KDFDCEIIYDGNTTFGVCGFKTLVKADASVPAVSAASILAKVTRDKKMVEFDEQFPEYGFKKNKGYGSKTHIEAISKFGLSPCHRKSFRIKSLSQKSLF